MWLSILLEAVFCLKFAELFSKSKGEKAVSKRNILSCGSFGGNHSDLDV